MHVAFSIGEMKLSELRARMKQTGVKEWKQNTNEGDSLYLLASNGHHLEPHCEILATLLAELEQSPHEGLVWC